MDNSISDDELAALGLFFEEDVSASPAESAPTFRAAEPPKPVKPVEKVMSQADIDALIASMNS